MSPEPRTAGSSFGYPSPSVEEDIPLAEPPAEGLLRGAARETEPGEFPPDYWAEAVAG